MSSLSYPGSSLADASSSLTDTCCCNPSAGTRRQGSAVPPTIPGTDRDITVVGIVGMVIGIEARVDLRHGGTRGVVHKQ